MLSLILIYKSNCSRAFLNTSISLFAIASLKKLALNNFFLIQISVNANWVVIYWLQSEQRNFYCEHLQQVMTGSQFASTFSCLGADVRSQHRNYRRQYDKLVTTTHTRHTHRLTDTSFDFSVFLYRFGCAVCAASMIYEYLIRLQYPILL